MTTKEASIKFKLNIEEVRASCKAELIPNAFKLNKKWSIPDDTEIILTKLSIRRILLDIIKYKNNNSMVISGKYKNNPDILNKIMKVLVNLNLIGEYKYTTDVESIFKFTQLTEDGFAVLFGGNKNNSKNIYFQLFNADIKIGLININ